MTVLHNGRTDGRIMFCFLIWMVIGVRFALRVWGFQTDFSDFGFFHVAGDTHLLFPLPEFLLVFWSVCQCNCRCAYCSYCFMVLLSKFEVKITWKNSRGSFIMELYPAENCPRQEQPLLKWLSMSSFPWITVGLLSFELEIYRVSNMKHIGHQNKSVFEKVVFQQHTSNQNPLLVCGSMRVAPQITPLARRCYV